MMEWEKCLAEKTIREVEPDKERARNMLKMIEIRQKFWDSVMVIHHDEYSSLLVEGYYEIIKELLTVYVNLNGLESSNHECLIRYFQKQNPDLVTEGEKIDELRKARNKIDYRGFFIKKEFFEGNRLEYQHIIKLLQKLVKEILKKEIAHHRSKTGGMLASLGAISFGVPVLSPEDR